MNRSTNPRKLRPPQIAIDKLIDYFASKSEQVLFIQVGANDGKSDDPIHQHIIEHQWSGALVEPQKYVFEHQLKKTYKNQPNLIFLNAAVGPEEQTIPFYQISFSNESWATGLASFNRDNLTKHIEQGYVDRKAKKAGVTPPLNKSEYIKETTVNIITFPIILERLHNKPINLLCIDVEGYDYEVLRLFDFKNQKPDCILFESKHLSDSDFTKSKNLLENAGYKLFWEKGNTVAINFKLPFITEVSLRLSGLWRKL